MPRSALPRRLRTLRHRRKMSQEVLAIEADVNASLISLMETGRRTNPSARVLRALAKALDTNSDYLLGLSEDSSPPDYSLEPSSELEWQLLERFRELSLEQQRFALALLDFVLEHANQHLPLRIVGIPSEREAEQPEGEIPP